MNNLAIKKNQPGIVVEEVEGPNGYIRPNGNDHISVNGHESGMSDSLLLHQGGRPAFGVGQ